MRTFKTTKSFFKDLKKQEFSAPLLEVLSCLANGNELPSKYLDHQLKGDLSHCRECHIKPDLLLVYEISENDRVVKLIALDSHSNLFK